jgi:hypothetical protein
MGFFSVWDIKQFVLLAPSPLYHEKFLEKKFFRVFIAKKKLIRYNNLHCEVFGPSRDTPGAVAIAGRNATV